MARRLDQARVVPEGLSYRASFLSGREERALLDAFEDIEFETFVMRGQEARRRVRHYGWRYSFDARELVPTDPLPDFLVPIRRRAEALAGLGEGAFEQALVTRYPTRASIGWHRDAPPFGPTLAGVSLGAACTMRFQRELEGVRYVHDQVLEPRSAYVLAGTARSAWQHHIPPAKALRHSITFRMLRERRG